MTAITNEAFSAMHAAHEQGGRTASTGSRVFPVRSLSEWQVRALQKLASFGLLGANWDSYGSQPLSESVLDAAVDLVSNISFEKVPALRITPISGGGVQLEWEQGERELAVEVRPDLTFGVSLSDRDEHTEASMRSLSPAAVERLLAGWMSVGR